MNWLARLEVVWVGVLACGCALESKSVGDPADTGSSSVDDGGEPSDSGDPSDGGSEGGGDPLCPGNPGFACTVPYPCTDAPCTADPFDDLDENGCPALSCSEQEDCPADSACVFIPSVGSTIFCMDDETSEEPSCQCGGTADANGRNQCVPMTAIEIETYCAGIEPGDECNAAPEIQYDGVHAWYCRTVEIQHLLLDEATDTCASDPQTICLASSHNIFGGEQGCGAVDCTWGPNAEPVFGGAIREIGPNEYQLISIPDNYCGEEQMPLGEWTTCTDAAFGGCACECA